MKKDLVQFITEKYHLLTDSEKMLSDYIINNLDQVLSISVQKLAEVTGLSVATVVRFAQHLGFEGYKDFRLYLAQFANEHEDFILDFTKNESSVDSQISGMLSSCIECLSLTEKNLDHSVLSSVVQAIGGARKIAFIGVGTSYIVCQDAAMKFKRVGVLADSACDHGEISAVMVGMREGDVIVGISHSGSSETVVGALKTARQLGITTVAVTTFKGSSITDYADFTLYTQTRESPLHKIAITSRVSQLAMMDSLLMAYFTAYYDDCMKSIERIYEIGDSMRGAAKLP